MQVGDYLSATLSRPAKANAPPSGGSDDPSGDPDPDVPRYGVDRGKPVTDREAWPWYLAPGDCADYDEAMRCAHHYGRVLEQIGGFTLKIHGRGPLTDVGKAS